MKEWGPEALIIYDELSAPGPDDPASLIKLRRTGNLIDADYPNFLSTTYCAPFFLDAQG
jgi:hypothetical protein